MVDRNYDAVVIGGGILGAWIAKELCEAGHPRTLLLEKNYPGAGATSKSSAILRVGDRHPTLCAMARHSLSVYREFEEDHGVSLGFDSSGMAWIYSSTHSEEVDRKIGELQQREVAATRWGPAELRSLEPAGVFTEDDCAIWEPETSSVHAVRALQGVLDQAKDAGVEIRVGAAARAIEVSGGAVNGVRLDSGEKISTETVINAAGPWAASLLPSGVSTPLLASRTEQAFFLPPTESMSKAIFADEESGLFWKPECAGWVRVGSLRTTSSPSIDPEHYDEGVSGSFVGQCRRTLAERVPAYRKSPSWGGCGALTTESRDGLPCLGAVPGADGLILAGGFGAEEFSVAPAVGAAIASQLSGQGWSFEVEAFAVHRPAGLAAGV